MAYTQARSGLARSGAVLAGLYPRLLFLTVGGTTRQMSALEFGITESVDVAQPNTATLVVHGVPVTPLQEVVLGIGHAQNRMFAGHVMRVAMAIEGFVATGHIDRAVVVNDYAWQLNAKDVVFKRFLDVGVNVAVGWILANCTEGGFRPGVIAQGLGNITEDFDGVTVVEALQRIAKAANAKCVVDYNRYVHVVISRDDGNALVLEDATRIWDLHFVEAADQYRNQTIFTGGGATTTAPVSPGATTIAVDECGHYAPTGGSAIADGQVVAYTGVSVGSGPGTLMGVTGVVEEISQGVQVRVRSTAADAGAATALAAILGGGVSGVVTHALDHGNASNETAIAGAAADVALFAANIATVTYRIESDFYAIGKTVTVNLTTPVAITGTYVIQAVAIGPSFDEGQLQSDGTVRFLRTVTLTKTDLRFLSSPLRLLDQLRH